MTQYYYDSRTCYYGVGQLINGNVNALTCTYNREKEEFLNYVPQQKCNSDHTFTPVSDPSLDNFKSYMLGNVKFNVGGTACVDCPKGQFPVTTIGYDCKVGIKKNMECAGDPALPSPASLALGKYPYKYARMSVTKKERRVNLLVLSQTAILNLVPAIYFLELRSRPMIQVQST